MSVKINCNRFRGLTESVDESDICTASQLLCGCGRDVADFQTQPQQHYLAVAGSTHLRSFCSMALLLDNHKETEMN
ncbi:hypothetical protein OUZ56_021135 [Daphnia magna]|uniref:Uncharacterized protein n=1 Tax=Daphnia magna TaxID=35525 RepID=A0ABQ9ZGH2_9CRUS|nr:hypothetical protein OUZ56_021135 [Daphnia magna]